MADREVVEAGLSSIKVALDITKEFLNIDISFKDAEVKLKLAKLIDTLSDAKFALSAVRDENLELKEKIKSLEAQLNQKEVVLFRDGHYYLAEPAEGKAEGPFCSNCFNTKKSLSLLTEIIDRNRAFGKYKCPSCEQRFEK